ncbi:MAG: PGF-pre-PGF domain-containing protein [Euryarchaeota archaeon]|nr:PGF-pre-PGF domain-containing protein [Euryarchaeota archaeon]
MLSMLSTAHADANQIVYYNWCEDTGNTIVDNSGYGNNGINYGSTTFILPTGQTARHFNGQNRVIIPENEQLAFTDPRITFGVFFSYNDNNPTNCTYLVSKGNDRCRIIIDHTDSTIKYEIYADGHIISGHSDCQIEPDEDYEAIVTYDGSNAQLYINGIASGKSVNYTAAALDSSYKTDIWTIGSSPGAEYGLNGNIYAFYEYNRTLNSSEVLDLYVNDLHRIRASDRPGGIALSWDDAGNIHSCYKYLPMFQKYNATCTMNANKVSHRQQNVIDELGKLHSAGWEIATHGHNHKNAIIFLNNSTTQEWLDQEIFPNIVELTRYGYPVCTHAYPNSARNRTTDALLSPYFRTLRTRTPNVINGNVNETLLAYYDWDNDQLLYGVEIDDWSGVSLQSIEYGIDRAIKTGTVLVLFGHDITSNVTRKYQTSDSRLESILNYTSQNGGVFYNMGDLGKSTWVRPARFSDVTAKFTVSADNVSAGESVIFKDHSINQTTELLDFGDGSPVSSTANIAHIYTKPGNYTANLTVANDVSSHSMLKTIKVILPPAPVANFTSNITSGNVPLTVQFSDISTGYPTAWDWDFGDGSSSVEQNPVHIYSAAGNFTVTLRVSNVEGADSKAAVITVLQKQGRDETIVLPEADFSTSVTGGYAPLSVAFTDLSNNTTSRSWDFGDGSSSVEQNPVHIYSAAGTYTVTLTAYNDYGQATKTARIFVDRERSSGSGGSGESGGSGGGGGGGSPEPAKNVEVKELSQVFITNGNNVKFDFPKNVTAIVNLSFDPKKTAGKTTTIVEMLKNKSTLTPDAPQGEVYRYLNIWVGNSGYANSRNIENAIVCFRVKKSWIEDQSIDQSSIILHRYSDKKWNELPTTLLREDDRYLYFTSETPGFSSFAITAKKIVIKMPTDNENPEKYGSIKSDIKKETDQAGNTSISQKENLSISGFEMIYCIFGLIGVLMYRRR